MSNGFLGVERQIADVQPGNVVQLQVAVGLDGGELFRQRRGDDLAFVGFQLGQPGLRIRRNREDQMLAGHFALPVVRVSDVADQRILLILLKRKWPGADRPVVDVFRRALFNIASAYSADRIEAKSIAQSATKAALGWLSVKRT